jgi:AcrR family transcriptional regulator
MTEQLFNILNMRSGNEVDSSTPDDRSAKVRIRDAAIGCFAEHGFAATTARKVATAAAVSPGLVMHHFESMEGLKAACNEHVASVIREGKDDVLSSGPRLDLLGALQGTDYDNLAAYIAQALVEDSATVDQLVDGLVADAEVYMQHGVDSGTLRPSDHPSERAALLTLWMLGGIVLHRHMKRLLGVDLTEPGANVDPSVLGYLRPAIEILGKGVLTEDFVTQASAALNSQDQTEESP